MMYHVLTKQQYFKSNRVSSFIDVGFHYTHSYNAASIRSNGLVPARGGYFGKGIYTASNATCFHYRSWGNSVGIIVFRLQGKTGRRSLPCQYLIEENINAIIGNKLIEKNKVLREWSTTDPYNEIILQSSSQCAPAIIFDASILDNTKGASCLQHLQISLQNLLNESLNECSTPTGMGKIIEDSSVVKLSRIPLSHSLITYDAPYSINHHISSKALAEKPNHCDDNPKKECVICYEELGTNLSALRILPCNHIFHRNCIEHALAVLLPCPVCRKWVGEPQGKCPTGKMIIFFSPFKCAGYQEDTIVIRYLIYPGMQKRYHVNPGVQHSGKNEEVYLPNNVDGQNLLKRLKYAFQHGLTFTVGTSLSTGMENQCTWSSIHHKTSLSGGIARHGYPDPSYFANCNDELDMLSVPPANLL